MNVVCSSDLKLMILWTWMILFWMTCVSFLVLMALYGEILDENTQRLVPTRSRTLSIKESS